MRTIVKSINELHNFISSNQSEELNLIIFDENGITNEGYEMIDFLTQNTKFLKNSLQNIIITIPYEKLPKSEFKKFYNLYNKITKTSTISLNFCVNHQIKEEFFVDEKEICWDFETILKANSSIDKVCSFLRASGLSPFEMLAYIHDYVSTIAVYRWSPDKSHTWYNKDQYFAGAFMEIPESVCMGQATLMKEIIDNLNIPELQCDIISVEFKQLEKHYIAGHSRCLIKIKDEKYGLDQTVFDDPTWDNDSSLSHKYSHFAMPNNTHEKEVNGLYSYLCPNKIVYSNQRAKKEIVDLNTYIDNYNNSTNKIDQRMIEIAYFNMLNKAYKGFSYEQKYFILKNMAQISFEEQSSRKFKGNLTKPNLLITKTLAKNIWQQNKHENENNKDAICL